MRTSTRTNPGRSVAMPARWLLSLRSQRTAYLYRVSAGPSFGAASLRDQRHARAALRTPMPCARTTASSSRPNARSRGRRLRPGRLQGSSATSSRASRRGRRRWWRASASSSSGDVTFGRDVVVRGMVSVQGPARIGDGTILTDWRWCNVRTIVETEPLRPRPQPSAWHGGVFHGGPPIRADAALHGPPTTSRRRATARATPAAPKPDRRCQHPRRHARASPPTSSQEGNSLDA